MKSLETLPQDIYNLFEINHEFNPDNVKLFGEKLAQHLANRISEERSPRRLRLSAIGDECARRVWLKANKPELEEKLRPETKFKFLYGDILEELILFLAAEAGHTVEGQQDEIVIGGVKGHRDAIIDGRIVDVKSASTFSFKKFKDNNLRSDDPFGYLKQIGSYRFGSREDNRVKEQDVVSFIAVDKQHGHICVDTYPADDVDYEALIEEKKAIVDQEEMPDRGYVDIPEGKSGNKKLCTNCSYCSFKKACWPEMRTFLYSKGPVFLTHVELEPKVPELTSTEEILND